MKSTAGSSHAAKRVQGALQQRSRGLCSATWVSKIAPRAPPETVKRAQEASESPPERSCGSQEASESRPNRCQGASRAAQTAPSPSKRPLGLPKEATVTVTERRKESSPIWPQKSWLLETYNILDKPPSLEVHPP